MRIVNRTQTLPLGRTDGYTIEGIVRTSGIAARAGGRGFVFERREPRAVMVRGEDDLSRIEIRPPAGVSAAAAVAPLAAYLLARTVISRRRKR
jgi:hypothetical protein